MKAVGYCDPIDFQLCMHLYLLIVCAFHSITLNSWFKCDFKFCPKIRTSISRGKFWHSIYTSCTPSHLNRPCRYSHLHSLLVWVLLFLLHLLLQVTVCFILFHTSWGRLISTVVSRGVGLEQLWTAIFIDTNQDHAWRKARLFQINVQSLSLHGINAQKKRKFCIIM